MPRVEAPTGPTLGRDQALELNFAKLGSPNLACLCHRLFVFLLIGNCFAFPVVNLWRHHLPGMIHLLPGSTPVDGETMSTCPQCAAMRRPYGQSHRSKSRTMQCEYQLSQPHSAMAVKDG